MADGGTQAVSVDRRHFFAPEVIQTSAMDCGPAALKSLMGGFGVDVSYGRLREACHTDVDGTSVDTIEELAVRLGMKAEQVMVPVDHVVLDEAQLLPCMVVVKLEGSGTHFVVVWRKIGAMLQVMDPASGRHWVPANRFLEDVYQHSQRVPAADWREWAASDGFAKPLFARLRRAGVSGRRAKELLLAAQNDPGWKSLAALDAAVHLAQSLREPTLVELASQPELIPADYWRITPAEDSEDEVIFKGAVAMRCEGRQSSVDIAALPESLRAVLSDRPPSAARELWSTIRAGGPGIPLAAALAGLVASCAVLIEALLLRSLFSLSPHLPRAGERFGTAVAFVIFLASLAAIEWAMEDLLRGSGRGLEVRLRARFSFKIPRLGDRYFQSRLISDMAQRAHAVQLLRSVPPLAMTFLRMLGSIVATVAGIIWFYPHTALQATLCGAAAILIPLLGQPWLVERDLRFREYAGSLTRFYLDALLGIVPVRTHGAGPALRYHQSAQLTHWARAGLRMQRTAVLLESLQMLLSYAAAAWLVYAAMDRNGGNAAALILLVYWALSLPEMGRSLSAVAWQWPSLRNSLLRLLEPLGAPEEALVANAVPVNANSAAAARIEMRDITVAIAGRPILEEINLTVEPGEHVGIVGLSGAGKSSLVGLLLGWYRPSTGDLLVDGEPLTAQRLHALRGETAWVDPQVQLWNDSLLANLRYGLTPDQPLEAARAIQQANLTQVIQSLPDGMQSNLGEGGALLSGGEGQRVRMARAYGKPGVRLAILDEPARGLDRSMREEFVARARESWKDATLLCITHDVASTKVFPRVLVIEGGRIVEDGSPAALYASADSRYRQLWDREDSVRSRLWNAVSWRRLRMDAGRLLEMREP